ncbi:ABC transporter substrate-binding protein SapA [Rheinheimera sp.]|uniref:ABC transporter substrate-binding protein SapA n=1 Tax=Rheinheimera sp. TaxID=1869214 RepID=UPI00307DB4C6
MNVVFYGSLLSSLCLLSACQPQLPQTLAEGLVYCAEGSPESFNPQHVTSGTTIDIVSQQLYDRLLDINPQSGELEAALAERWRVSEDGRTYWFELKQQVQFHHTGYFSPSRPLQAADVVFTFERILDTHHPYHPIGGGDYPYFESVDLRSLVTAVTAETPLTVRFDLSRPDSSFLSNLATDFASILSAEYAAQLLQQHQPELLDSQPVGTGPFMFRDYKKDQFVRYYRHPEYWGGKAQLSQLVFDLVPDSAKRMAMLLTHECDVVAYPRHAELKLVTERPDVEVQSQISMNVGFWAFNTQKAPFNNAKVRKALAMAIDRNTILQAVYFGHADLARSVLPPTSWAFDNNAEELPYQPELAKQLLAEAGYPKGFQMDIWAMPVQRLYNPNAQKMAELMQADLARIGVRARIVSLEWNSFRRKLSDNEHDSVLIGWSADNADPDNFFRPLLSCAAAQNGSNRANWCDPKFDNLLNQALLTADPQQRRSFYLAAQHYLAEQMPLFSIAHSKRFQAQSVKVSGVVMSPYGGVSMAKAEKDL